MVMLCLEFIVILGLMLAATAVFTNAVEHGGKHYGIGKGVLGSIVAAVATALPEAMVPIVAFFGKDATAATQQNIIIGAILGPPLMLVTVALPIMAFAALPKRGWRGFITPESRGVRRDLKFMGMALLIASSALFMPHNYWRSGCSLVLSLLYLSYIYYTYRAVTDHGIDSEPALALEPLLLARFGVSDSKLAIIAQLLAGLLLLLGSAKILVTTVVVAARLCNFPVLLTALLLIPIATELPEKLNSVMWIRRRQDTLAVANITGAMVFQSTILPALGLSLVAWQPQPAILLSILITATAACWLAINVRPQGIRITSLLVMSYFYGAYYVAMLML